MVGYAIINTIVVLSIIIVIAMIYQVYNVHKLIELYSEDELMSDHLDYMETFEDKITSILVVYENSNTYLYYNFKGKANKLYIAKLADNRKQATFKIGDKVKVEAFETDYNYLIVNSIKLSLDTSEDRCWGLKDEW